MTLPARTGRTALAMTGLLPRLICGQAPAGSTQPVLRTVAEVRAFAGSLRGFARKNRVGDRVAAGGIGVRGNLTGPAMN